MTKLLRILLLPLAACLLPSCDGCGTDDDDDPIPVPTAPTGLGLNAPSSGRIEVTWTDTSGVEAGFRIEFSTDGISFAEIGTAPANATMFIHRGLVPNTTYWYQVRAFNSSGTTGPVGPAMTTTQNVGWTALAAGPDRAEHSAIYDPIGQRMIIFGGMDGFFTVMGDVWELTLGVVPAWNMLTPTGGPIPTRFSHTAVYDAANQRMIVFGGADGTTFQPLNDVWELVLTPTPAWNQLTPTGGPPPERIGHTAIYDASNQRMVIFGGVGFGPNLDDVWELSLGGAPVWNQITALAGPTRDVHVSVYDDINQRMLTFGGADDIGAVMNELWELTLGPAPAWTLLAPTGLPPSPRTDAAAIIDSTDERFVLFSGRDGDPINDEAWFLAPLAPSAWNLAVPTGGPPAGRDNHVAVYDSANHRMIIHGGNDNGFVTQMDTWALGF